MLLNRKRNYYLLRELECVSCRTKSNTRVFVDSVRMIEDELDCDDATIEVFCIDCAHKADFHRQAAARKEHVDEAIKLMYLREAAKIPTRYDAYRLPTKEPLLPNDVHRIVSTIPCEACGGQHTDPLWRWPDHRHGDWVSAERNNDVWGMIDDFRDAVWLCPVHRHDKQYRLSRTFDENFYRSMSTLYS